jgi:asparagine synthetase B (glutamine-hydrolysing)
MPWPSGAKMRSTASMACLRSDSTTLRNVQLLLARDHAGIKPLYYLMHREGLMFGSQYDQLLAHPWSQATGLLARCSLLVSFAGFDSRSLRYPRKYSHAGARQLAGESM